MTVTVYRHPMSLSLATKTHLLRISIVRRWSLDYTDFGYRDELPKMLSIGPFCIELFRWHSEDCGCRGCRLNAWFSESDECEEESR